MSAPEPPAWATSLGLQPHPEGGWFVETWRSALTLPADVLPSAHGGDRAAGTAILFLLPAGVESAWHTVVGSEIWLHHRGAAVELELGGTGAAPVDPTTVLLGPDVAAGQIPQHVVSPGEWQRARPAPLGARDAGHHDADHHDADHDDSDGAALVSCVVVPGFDFDDFALAPD